MQSATDRQQLMDEVFFLGQDKKFVLNLKDFLKASIPFEKIEKKLIKKRKAYNYAFVNVLKKYRICPDNLYSDLDALWTSSEDILKKDDSRASAVAWGVGSVAGVATVAGSVAVSGGLAGVAIALGAGAAEANRLRKVWSTYLAATLVLAERITSDDATPST